MKVIPAAVPIRKKSQNIGGKLCGLHLMVISVIITLTFIFFALLLHSRLHEATDSQLALTDSIVDHIAPTMAISSSSSMGPTVILWVVTNFDGLRFRSESSEDIHAAVTSILIGDYNETEKVFTVTFPFQGKREFLNNDNMERFMTKMSIPYGNYLNDGFSDVQTTDSSKNCANTNFISDADFVGNDLGNIDNVDVETCCQTCSANTLCTHWTYVQSSQSCWMKGGGNLVAPVPIVKPAGSTLISGIIPNKRQLSGGLVAVSASNSMPAVESISDTYAACCNTKIIAAEATKANSSLLLKDLSVPAWIMRYNMTNGDWTEQHLVGNGHIGALVGGNSKREIIPISCANWFAHRKRGLEESKEKSSSMSAHYMTGRAHLKTGNVAEAITSLSNVQTSGLGMFQYLSDLAIYFSPLPLRMSDLKVARSSIEGKTRASINDWFSSLLQSSHSSNLVSTSLVSEGVLDMKSGVSSQNHFELHTFTKESPELSDIPISSNHNNSTSNKRWITASHRRWFASAVDDVLVGSMKCKVVDNNNTGKKNSGTTCLNVALGFIREIPETRLIPTVTYDVKLLDGREGARSTFIIDFSISSSQLILVPTTHMAAHITCYHGSASIVGSRSERKMGFSDSPLAVCNAAARMDIVIAVAVADTLGQSPAQYDTSTAAMETLKQQCHSRIENAAKKGMAQLYSDHVHQVTTAMNAVTLTLDPYVAESGTTHCTNTNYVSETSLKQFGQGCFNQETKNFEQDIHDSKLVNQLYVYGRYLLLASAQQNVPNLQGLWADGVKAEWNGDYHMNINIQMMYWAAASAFPLSSSKPKGSSEQPQHAINVLKPLVRFMKRLAKNSHITAQTMYSEAAKAAVVKQTFSELAWVAHGFTDSTLRGDVMADLQWSLCVTCGAWIATHLFDFVLYSNEVDWNQEIVDDILDIFRGIAEFFEAHLFALDEKHTDVLFTGPTTSPENSYMLKKEGNKGIGQTVYLTFSPAIDVSILREFSNSYHLLTSWIKTAKQLKFKDSFDFYQHAKDFQMLVAKMPNHGIPMVYEDSSTVANTGTTATLGTPAIKSSFFASLKRSVTASILRIREYPVSSLTSAPMKGQQKQPQVDDLQVIENADNGHRHFSLMHWLYPAQFLPFTSAGISTTTTNPTPSQLFQAAKETLQVKRQHFGGHTSWSAVWEASLWARLGEGEEAFISLKHMISRYLTTNLLSLHPPLDADGPGDCHTCFSDMFHQQYEAQQQEAIKTYLEKLNNDKNQQHRKLQDKLSIPDSQRVFTPPALGIPPLLPQAVNEAESIKIVNDKKPFLPPKLHNDIGHLRGNPLNPPVRVEGLGNHPPNSFLPRQLKRAPVDDVTRRRGLVTQRGDKFQLDGNLGYVAAIQEMLIQSHMPRRVSLLPAIPKGWTTKGLLSGIGIRGDAQVSVSWENGHISFAQILFGSILHPWWSHQIIEKEHFPGFYEDQVRTEEDSQKLEITIFAPNALRLLKTDNKQLMRDYSNELCIGEIKPDTMCEGCEKFPYQQKMVATTVYIQSAIASSCLLLVCHQSLTDEDCIQQHLLLKNNSTPN